MTSKFDVVSINKKFQSTYFLEKELKKTFLILISTNRIYWVNICHTLVQNKNKINTFLSIKHWYHIILFFYINKSIVCFLLILNNLEEDSYNFLNLMSSSFNFILSNLMLWSLCQWIIKNLKERPNNIFLDSRSF